MSASAVRYRFARSGDGSVIEISELNPENRASRGPFVCLGCQSPLIARLGKQVSWHFAHARHAVCAPETQLHQLAKELFYSTYAKCLEQKVPYQLIYKGRAACSRSASLQELQCAVEEERTIDLTQHYDRVELEGRVDSFVADVLLSSSRSSHVLLIEIAVTHTCDPKKIDHGARIIELRATSENEVSILRERKLDATSAWARTYNFGTALKQSDICKGECTHHVDVFSVYRSGKARIVQMNAAEAAASEPRSSLIYQSVRSDAMDVGLVKSWNFQSEVLRAYSRGIDVKNCYLCRYQGTSEELGRIFCRTKRQHLPSNSAAECDRYRPLPRAEAVKVQQELDDSHKAHHDWHRYVRLK